jgi:hypothetical protein
MALSGTLKDFGIADILQLVAQQGKTGKLQLKAQKRTIDIFLRQGLIYAVEVKGENPSRAIVDSLIDSETLDPERAQTVGQHEQLSSLQQALAEHGIEFEEVAQVHQRLALETLYACFGWKEGTYRFDPSDGEERGFEVGRLKTEPVLMEAFRQLDDWPRLREKAPRESVSYERTGLLPSAGFEDGDEYSEEERRLFALVAPGRDLRKLAAMAALSRFDATAAVVKLLTAGLIRVVAAKSSPARQRGHKNQMASRRDLPWREALVALGLVTGLGLAVLFADVSLVALARGGTRSVEDRAAQRVISRAQLSRIQTALDVYQLEFGEFPTTLDALVEHALLQSEDLSYPWQSAYHYRRVAPHEFVLLPPLQ